MLVCVPPTPHHVPSCVEIYGTIRGLFVTWGQTFSAHLDPSASLSPKNLPFRRPASAKRVRSVCAAARGYSCPEWVVNLLAKSDSLAVRWYIWTYAATGVLIWFWLQAAHQTLSARCYEPMKNGRHANGRCKRAEVILDFFSFFKLSCPHGLI